MHRIMWFLPARGSQHSRLEVTADHRVLNVTHEGEKRQVAEWWPKKSCFDIETQDPQQLIALDKVLSSPTGGCVFR